MPKFRILPVLMALGVTFNHFHCIGTAVEAASAVIEQVRRAEVNGASQDLGSIPKCENETGCICQGAIFIAPAPFDLIDLSACPWNADVPPTPAETCPRLELHISRAALEQCHIAPPISGGALRAWLGSFLI